MSVQGNSYQQNLTKGLESSLQSQLIENGKLRFTKDTGRLFVDLVEGVVSKRIKISEVINDKTEDQIINLVGPIVGKIYLSTDTHRAFTYTGTTMVDLASLNLSVATSEDVDKPLWFSDTSDDSPSYDTDVTYNTSTEELKAPNVVASESVKVNGMIITESSQTIDDKEVHTVRFNFS